MRLESTFRDYYDPFFDGKGDVFRRIGGNVGPTKREQFALLMAADYEVPPHGLFEDLIGEYWEAEDWTIERCVVYDDETAHCGEGKRMSRRVMEEFDRSTGKFACAFVGDPNANGVSHRLLQVGPHRFWIEYRSNESWMSNVGDGSCETFAVEKGVGYHPHLPYPLFAIDFVLGKDMRQYAVDFNTAPGIRGSGVEKFLSGPEAVEAIEGWFAHESRGAGRPDVQPGPEWPHPAGE
jgi:hypothetical protein